MKKSKVKRSYRNFEDGDDIKVIAWLSGYDRRRLGMYAIYTSARGVSDAASALIVDALNQYEKQNGFPLIPKMSEEKEKEK
jgi:hypothetical protein